MLLNLQFCKMLDASFNIISFSAAVFASFLNPFMHTIPFQGLLCFMVTLTPVHVTLMLLLFTEESPAPGTEISITILFACL